MKNSMKNARRIVLLALLAAAAIAPTPGNATSATVFASIQFQTFGSGNPELIYDFDGYHMGEITEFSPLVALFPATFQGSMLKGSLGVDACNKSAKIKNASFYCQTAAVSYCPAAEGVWTTRTRLAASTPPVGKVWSATSGQLWANCPPIEPPGCGGSYKSTQLLAIDLDTGRISWPEWTFEAPRGLERTERVADKPYFREEWVLVSTSGPGQTVTLASASDASGEQVDDYISRLVGTPGFDTEHRYLVIEAARHIGHRAEPLIRLASLENGSPLGGELSDGRVTFRASFYPDGRLEGVETIEGSERTARVLAEDLRVEFPLADAEHETHRAVVFATFEVESGRPRFVAAAPLLPQCCCGEFHCV